MLSKYNVFVKFFYYMGVMFGIFKFKLIIKKQIMTRKSIPLQIYGLCLPVFFTFVSPFAIIGFHDLMTNAFKSANHTIFELMQNSRIALQLFVVLSFFVKVIIKKKTFEELISKFLWIHNEILVKHQRFPVSSEKIFYLMIFKVIFLEMIVPYSYLPFLTRSANWNKDNMILCYSFMCFVYYGFNFISNLYYIGILYISHVYEVLNLQLLIVLKKAEFMNSNLTELLECSDEIDKLATIYCEITNFLKSFMEFVKFFITLHLITNFLTSVGQVI